MDINKLAKSIVDKATKEEKKEEKPGKNPAAVALGRLGGLKGGRARAEKLTKEERSEIAKKAAKPKEPVFLNQVIPGIYSKYFLGRSGELKAPSNIFSSNSSETGF